MTAPRSSGTLGGVSSDHPYVSRGGVKLAAALAAFNVDPNGWVCADLGSHVGGFVDCLLRHGAAKVYSIDTAYGTLAWTLRKDPSVVVMERTNALHATLPEPVDLVTIDVGWTRQHIILPAALMLLKPGGTIITLIKPHYEAERGELRGGVLPVEKLAEGMERLRQRLTAHGISFTQTLRSPILGQAGNAEVLGLIKPPSAR